MKLNGKQSSQKMVSNMNIFKIDSTPIAGKIILEASAGTGKTYALERIVARLISRKKAPLPLEKILVVTFTNRAANDMKERIRIMLLNLANNEEQHEREAKLYREAIANFHKASIYTIHGFCRMVLSTWPFESNSPFNLEVINDSEIEKRQLYSWLAGLTQGMLEDAVMHYGIECSGSVSGSVERLVSFLMSRQNSAWRSSTLIPTEETLRRFDQFIESSKGENSPWERALRKLCEKLVDTSSVREIILLGSNRKKQEKSLWSVVGEIAGLKGGGNFIRVCFLLFTEKGEFRNSHFGDFFESSVLCGASSVASSGASSKELSQPARELQMALHQIYLLMREWLDVDEETGKIRCLIGEYLRISFLEHAGSAVEKRLEKTKKQCGILNYNDLIQRVCDEVMSSDSLLSRTLRRSFTAALIDEFQDTDPNQWAIFSSLFGKRDRPLVLIGDPKQSIYRFRGTGLQVYSNASASVKDSDKYRLDTNYRSSAVLVELANLIFEPVFQAGVQAGPGFKPVKVGKKAVSQLSWRGKIQPPLTVMDVAAKEEAYDAIVAEIHDILDSESQGFWEKESGNKMPVCASDIAVLVRSRNDEDVMFRRLKSRGIPARRVRDKSVFEDQPLLPPVCGVLQALENPEDAACIRSVLLDDFFLLTAWQLFDFEKRGGLESLQQKLSEWKELFTSGQITRVFELLFEYAHEVEKTQWPLRVIAEPDGERKWHDFSHIMELLEMKLFEDFNTIADIRRWLAEAGEDGSSNWNLRLENDLPAVHLMTMHASKGLEFPLVFICAGYNTKTRNRADHYPEYIFNTPKDLIVDRLRQNKHWKYHLLAEWEEAKRLWYVAFTRASSNLWIPHIINEKAVNQFESLLFLSLEAKASAGEHEQSLPPHERIVRNDIRRFRQRFDELLAHFQANNPHLLSIRKISETERTAISKPAPRKLILARLPESETRYRDPFTSSYSSLLRDSQDSNNSFSVFSDNPYSNASSDESRDRDDSTNVFGADSEAKQSKLLLSERGALFGTLVHSLFEQCPFDTVSQLDAGKWKADPSIEKLFQTLSQHYYSLPWYLTNRNDLKQIIRETLHAPIPHLGRLCDLPSEARRAEAGFQMQIPQNSCIQIEDYEDIKISAGFIKGYIDLLVKHQDKWWIIDWKTNVPDVSYNPEHPDELYSMANIEQMMKKHNYQLQYELYLLALCRTLKNSVHRKIDWNNEIGGAMYLFVRGMNEEDDRGIYMVRPEKQRMQNLASSMNMEPFLI